MSGLDQSELCWIRRLVRAIGSSCSRSFAIRVSHHHTCTGITLEPTFSRRSTHLLCPGGAGAKFDKALEWQIPVVSLTWLADTARTGIIPRVNEYLIGGSHVGTAVDEGSAFGYVPHPHPTPEVKGKGKAKEVDYQMMGITNGNVIHNSLLCSMFIISLFIGDSTNQPIFVKNAALLQDTVLQDREANMRHHCQKSFELRSPPRDGSFGKPRLLTHDLDPPEEAEAHGSLSRTSSPAALPPLSSSPPPVETELPLFDLTPPKPVSPVRTRQLIDKTRGVSKVNTTAQVKTDVQAQAPTPTRTQGQAQIPSSTSPSPMKLLPSSSLPNAFDPSSPAHLPDTDTITKALHESLTSLLGKRPIAEEDRDEVMRDAGVTGAKKGKRVRPGGPSNVRVFRSRIFSHSASSLSRLRAYAYAHLLPRSPLGTRPAKT